MVILIILISLVVRLFFIHPTFSDENFYFNVGKFISQGHMPYIDFFFAHPPLQVYLLTAIIKIFGPSFFILKILPIVVTSLSAFILYLILVELKERKIGVIAVIFFILTPSFLAFSNIEDGMWEAMLFVLISVYFILKGDIHLSSLSFLIAFLFRYLSIIYLPFIFILSYLVKLETKRFLLESSFLLLLSILILYSIFGKNYITQTFFYHLLKTGVPNSLSPQYWSVGYFTFFLSLISAFIAYSKRNNIMLLFSLTPLVVDIFLLLVLKVVFYHYFIISVGFCMIASAWAWKKSKNQIVKIVIPLIFLISIVTNYPTLNYYLNPVYAEKFYLVSKFIHGKGSMFGEPCMTNYMSFITGRKIVGNYLDSYILHLRFENESNVIKTLNEKKPEFFIEMKFGKNYYYLSNKKFKQFIKSYYVNSFNVSGLPSYLVFRLKP